MICHRCSGLMVREDFDEVVGWRCVNCGAIVDPLIVANQLHRSVLETSPQSR